MGVPDTRSRIYWKSLSPGREDVTRRGVDVCTTIWLTVVLKMSFCLTEVRDDGIYAWLADTPWRVDTGLGVELVFVSSGKNDCRCTDGGCETGLPGAVVVAVTVSVLS